MFGPGGKVGNVYMKRLLELFILICVINYCGITFELLPSHQLKYSTLAQNLFRDLIAKWIRSYREDIFIQMELQKIYSYNC